MVLFINPANRAPGVHTGPAPGGGGGGGGGGGSWVKHKKNLLLRNHKAQSFHILCVAIYSVPLYKSCQPCPCGPHGPHPGGVMMKIVMYDSYLLKDVHSVLVNFPREYAQESMMLYI